MISGWVDLINGKNRKEKYFELPVLSGSMMPVLVPGKNIRIKRRIQHSEIQTGDIIVFKNDNTLTAHRVLIKLSVAGKAFMYQKGDMNRFGYWITDKKIVGYVYSAQDTSNKYINFESHAFKKQAQEKALNEILKTFLNISLILPRKIKQWLKKITTNFV